MADGVWLVTGVQAAGKSTVADLLARQFERGVHVRGGQFYRWAVRGWVHAGDEQAADARRLLDLRYRLAALTADEYCRAGFCTVVQDNIFGADVSRWLDSVAARPRRLVVLRPSMAVVRQRELQRHAATGKVAYRPGWFSPEDLDGFLAETPRIGLWLDTSALTAEQTVRQILRRQAEAVVDGALAAANLAGLAVSCAALNPGWLIQPVVFMHVLAVSAEQPPDRHPWTRPRSLGDGIACRADTVQLPNPHAAALLPMPAAAVHS